jgi:hypothetical protein
VSKRKKGTPSPADWHSWTDPFRLIRWTRDVATPRRYLLLSCAIVRHWPGGIRSDLGRQVLAAIEQTAFSDGPAAPSLIADVLAPRFPAAFVAGALHSFQAVTPAGHKMLGGDVSWLMVFLRDATRPGQAPRSMPNLLLNYASSGLYGLSTREVEAEAESIRKGLTQQAGFFGRLFGPSSAEVRDALVARLPEPPASPPPNLEGAKLELARQRHQRRRPEVMATFSRLVRDVFGEPYAPWTPNAAWVAAHDGAARSIAEGIEHSGDFSALPVLGDALEEAGCADAAALSHCRGEGPHVRGCWVVEAVLVR